MKAYQIILGIFLSFASITGYAKDSNDLPLSTKRAVNPFQIIQVAQECRPKDALPSGSYQNSCRNCRIEGCKWLVCRCDGKDASADTTTCPQDNYCNNNGGLQCGEC